MFNFIYCCKPLIYQIENIIQNPDNITDLKKRIIIGSSSKRRELQLKKISRNIDVVNIRGNVDTRIKKLSDKQVNILLEWQGEYLLVPEGIEITPEAMKLIHKRHHTWHLFWATEEEIAESRKHLVDCS